MRGRRIRAELIFHNSSFDTSDNSADVIYSCESKSVTQLCLTLYCTHGL